MRLWVNRDARCALSFLSEAFLNEDVYQQLQNVRI